MKKRSSDNTVKRLIVFAVSIGLLLIVWQTRYLLVGWQKLGYLGLFLINLISSSTVFLPLPGTASVFLGGAFWEPFTVGWVSGLGAALGELSGYFLGYGTRGLAMVYKGKKSRNVIKAERFFGRHGFITTLLFAVLPTPFDFVGLMAGSLNYSLWKFFLATFLGRSIRNFLIAWTGAKVLPV